MSYRRVAAALELDSIRGMQKLALVALAHFENDKTGVCNPSYDTIGRMVGIKKREVGTLVRDLVRAGVITAKKTKSSSVYTFSFQKQDRQETATLENQEVQNSATQEEQKTATPEWQNPATKQGSITENNEQRNNKVSITTTPTPPTCGGGLTPPLYPKNFKQVLDYLKSTENLVMDEDFLFANYVRVSENHWLDKDGCPIRDWRNYFAALNRIRVAECCSF